MFELRAFFPSPAGNEFEIDSHGKGDIAHLKDVSWHTSSEIISEDTGTRLIERSTMIIKNNRNERIMSFVYRYDAEHETVRFYIKDSRGMTVEKKLLPKRKYMIPVWCLPDFIHMLTCEHKNAEHTFDVMSFQGEEFKADVYIKNRDIKIKNANLTLYSTDVEIPSHR